GTTMTHAKLVPKDAGDRVPPRLATDRTNKRDHTADATEREGDYGGQLRETVPDRFAESKERDAIPNGPRTPLDRRR
ncbi:MAG TPA: hypothetical protein PLD05_06025, partial [Thermogutta sp.]|nr:hypothetical protein [Thermogutta sp.]